MDRSAQDALSLAGGIGDEGLSVEAVALSVSGEVTVAWWILQLAVWALAALFIAGYRESSAGPLACR